MMRPTISLPARTSGVVVADALGVGVVVAARAVAVESTGTAIAATKMKMKTEERIERTSLVTRGIYRRRPPSFNICSRPS